MRAGKKDDVKGGVLRRRDPVFVCSPWPGASKPGPWLPRLPFSGFLGPPSVQHGGTSSADRKCYDSNGQTNRETGLCGRCPQPHTPICHQASAGGASLWTQNPASKTGKGQEWGHVRVEGNNRKEREFREEGW